MSGRVVIGCLDLYFKCLELLYLDVWTCILGVWTCILGVGAGVDVGVGVISWCADVDVMSLYFSVACQGNIWKLKSSR